MMMKRLIVILSIVIGVFTVGILGYRWDSGTNRGYTWGYWGEFNTVSNSLAKLPGVKVFGWGCNADMTLEEFDLDIAIPDGRFMKVWFQQDDPIRKLSGETLAKALLVKIQTESATLPGLDTPGVPPQMVTGSNQPVTSRSAN